MRRDFALDGASPGCRRRRPRRAGRPGPRRESPLARTPPSAAEGQRPGAAAARGHRRCALRHRPRGRAGALFDTAYGEGDPLGIVATAKDLGCAAGRPAHPARRGDVGASARRGGLRARVAAAGPRRGVRRRVTRSPRWSVRRGRRVRRLDDGFALGTSPRRWRRSAGDGGLGDTEAFRTAVPTPTAPATSSTSTSPARWRCSATRPDEVAEDVEQLQSVRRRPGRPTAGTAPSAPGSPCATEPPPQAETPVDPCRS